MRGRAIGEHQEARRAYDGWKHANYRAAMLARHERAIALDKLA